jgi:hypothetical protein
MTNSDHIYAQVYLVQQVTISTSYLEDGQDRDGPGRLPPGRAWYWTSSNQATSAQEALW